LEQSKPPDSGRSYVRLPVTTKVELTEKPSFAFLVFHDPIKPRAELPTYKLDEIGQIFSGSQRLADRMDKLPHIGIPIFLLCPFRSDSLQNSKDQSSHLTLRFSLLN